MLRERMSSCLKRCENRRIGRQFGAYDLECDQTVKLAVASLVDSAHAALPENAKDFIAFAEKNSGLQALKGRDTAKS